MGTTVDYSNGKLDWKLKKIRDVTDVVHPTIFIYHPIDLIIDKQEFQRLRNLTQLGVAYLVYPSADHSRFGHSLGVYHLSLLMMKRLMELECSETLGITSTDMLCVCIAGLCHDLGHGPFSHMYDRKFLKAMGVPHFRHEEMSCKLFRHMLEKYADLKKELDVYLDERDYTFIEELIDPPKPLLRDGKWRPKGRPIQKAFLYEIVNNQEHGLDVDKIDYLVRDSILAGVGISFNHKRWHRILETIAVTNGYRYPRLIYSEKVFEDLKSIFTSRTELHQAIYKHKTVVAADTMLVEALALADPQLDWELADGRKFRMSNAVEEPEAFLQLDNRVTSRIECSTAPELEPARAKMKAIQKRQFPKKAGEFEIDHKEKENKLEPKELASKILSDLKAFNPTTVSISVEVLCFDGGMGVRASPLNFIPLYANKDPQKVTQTSIDPNRTGGVMKAYVYVSYEDRAEKECVRKALEQLRASRPGYMVVNENQEPANKRARLSD